ncbi:hypothetical protein Y1Q_0014371 [Alligator mississippiensis]|uniref:Uncharacterized protein n=1 Tax=Alligator mississippiensis TaxID=8496 RepID=A0A151NRD4_ALLMI|nr:hypothetical protein Y1Q_0014371 [Alligator mississippiensis]
MARNCSSTTSSSICSLLRRWGSSQRWASSRSRLKTSCSPLASRQRTARKRWRQVSGVTPSVKVEDMSSDTMQPGESWPEQPRACHADRPLEESGDVETLGPRDNPPDVPREDNPPPREPGAGTLSRAEQQPPEEGPGNLELQRTSPGRLEERSSLTHEPGQVQRGQGRPPKQEESWEVSRAPGSARRGIKK